MSKNAKFSRVVGTDVRRAERSITIAMRDTAQAAVTMLEGSLTLGFGADVGHDAICKVASTFSRLADGRDTLVMGAHRDLARLGRRIGLTEVDWGGSVPKGEDDLPAAPVGSVPESQPA